MVDLVKIRKKKARNAGVSPADAAASPPPPPVVEEKPGGEDAAGPAGGDAGAPNEPSKLERFKQTAGTKRENKIAQEATQPAQRLELLTFVIAHEHYAVDIERIVEIVTPRAVTRIPNADLSVVGIMSLRGTIVTLVDVRRKLRHPPAGEPDADTRIVVIDNKNEMIGFVVDRVLRVVKAAADEIEPHPVVHSAELDEAVRGVFRAGDALTILLDLDKLLASQWN
ncbi:MAG TPA: chemotaxis protein CheW [Thermoanaerobaculia bacterium]|nr:chemotaxis protein CheW [Thermoanaerobaculia bacterium]